MAKKLAYSVAMVPNRLTGGVFNVPSIRDRGPALPLEEIVRRAIDRNRIAGLKTNAAKSIADGIAAQMREEFLDGNSVNFGSYFYARPYLTGKCDINGKLTDENQVVVRLHKGPGFKLNRQDFDFVFIGEKGIAIDFVISDAPNAKKSEMVKGKTLFLFGENMSFDQSRGDTATLRWKADGEDASATLDVANSGVNMMSIEWSAELDSVAPGTEATLEITQHLESGNTFEATTKLTVVAG